MWGHGGGQPSCKGSSGELRPGDPRQSQAGAGTFPGVWGWGWDALQRALGSPTAWPCKKRRCVGPAKATPCTVTPPAGGARPLGIYRDIYIHTAASSLFP